MTKAFVSYHHANDQLYKDQLVSLAKNHGAFEDGSVKLGEIDDKLSNETIRQIIRDEYLRDTQVTILLCGTETHHRKHVDWELKSSMINGKVNKKSGILVINLPETSEIGYTGLPGEEEAIYGGELNWIILSSKREYQSAYPHMPERIIDNLMKSDVSMSVVPWFRIEDQPWKLQWLINATATAGRSNNYDLSLSMRKKN